MTRTIMGVISGIFLNLIGFITGAITPMLFFQQKMEKQGYRLPEIYLRTGDVLLSPSYRISLFCICIICGALSGVLLTKIMNKRNDRAVLVLAAVSSFSNFVLWSRILPLHISFILSLAVFFAILAGAWIAGRMKAQPKNAPDLKDAR